MIGSEVQSSTVLDLRNRGRCMACFTILPLYSHGKCSCAHCLEGKVCLRTGLDAFEIDPASYGNQIPALQSVTCHYYVPTLEFAASVYGKGLIKY